MEPKNNPDALLNKLAAHLAKPFLLPGQSGQPLSLRCLPDGGMVVIAADGRKLWFTAREVGAARRQLDMSGTHKPASPVDDKAPRLHDIDPRKVNYTPYAAGKTRDGLSELIVLPENLKHLEKTSYGKSGRRKNTRPPNSG